MRSSTSSDTRLGCGRIRENHRVSTDTTLVLVIRKREDLLTRVIPFFERQPLLSSKQQDFFTFARIVRAMAQGEHLTAEGFDALRDGGNLHERRRPVPTSSSNVSIQNPQRPYAEHPPLSSER